MEKPIEETGLDCLSYSGVIAQSIAVIAPSTVPAAVLGLIFVSAETEPGFSFLLATIGLLFVCFNINQFARRSASPGSLYTYIVKGLGPIAGVLSAWACCLVTWSQGDVNALRLRDFCPNVVRAPWDSSAIPVLFAFGVIVSYGVAYKDIQLSAKMMLIFEGISILSILVLGVLI